MTYRHRSVLITCSCGNVWLAVPDNGGMHWECNGCGMVVDATTPKREPLGSFGGTETTWFERGTDDE